MLIIEIVAAILYAKWVLLNLKASDSFTGALTVLTVWVAIPTVLLILFRG